PDFYLKNIFSVTPEFLKENGIKALLLDADNTLCIYHTDYPVDGVLNWIEDMQRNSIDLHILSNGKQGRLTNFAKNVNLPCFYLSLKPLPFKISKAVKKLGFKKNQVALVGDQMFTDILGGNLARVKTIWLDYIEIEESFSFRFKRKIEDKIKSKLKEEIK
ncbi:MAG: YqeG family HAD IIIA-type phosphatase, partial [Clostridia bacterium]|nr:YqeG family HAD IIIA-type phosphatase [Clostridia bacterium]